METSLSQFALSRVELCYNTASSSRRLVTTLHNIDDHCIPLSGKGSCFMRRITERQPPSPTAKHKYVDATHLC